MSTTVPQTAALDAPVERRFYSRFAPSAPIYIAFGERNRGILLNISENGLLVSTPDTLKRNFVSRLSVHLKGLPSAIHVHARVVWASESAKRAGIQLLDLSEHDREQIRKWGALESVQSAQPEVNPPPVAAMPSAPAPVEQPPMEWPVPPIVPAVVVHKRRGSVAADALWGLLFGTVCVAAVFFFKNISPREIFARSAESPIVSAPASATQDVSGSTMRAAASSPLNSETTAPAPNGLSAAAIHSTNAKKAAADAASADTRKGKVNVDRDSISLSPATTTKAPVVIEPAASNPSQTTVLPSPMQAAEMAPAPVFNAPQDAPVTQAVPRGDEVTANGLIAKTTPPPVPNSPLPNSARVSGVSSASNDLVASSASTASSSPIIASTRPGYVAGSSVAAGASRLESRIIYMDAPQGTAMEIRPPRGFRSSFFDLPGERVLESSSVTIHVQRSLLLPSARPWWPFNRDKKAVIGELISRVDPQATPAQVGSGYSVRVKATVAEDGHVERVEPMNGPATLIPAVVRAVREWRYQPTLLDDKPIETQSFIVVQFRAQARSVKQ